MPAKWITAAVLWGAACGALFLPAVAQDEHQTQPLDKGWQLQSACMVQADGQVIASNGFVPSGWLGVSVPATVLAGQVAGKVFPDPYFGDNLRKLPGADYPIGQNLANLPMPANSPYRCGWWYRTTFQQAAKPAGSRTWIRFGGINYRGDIWLNGKHIAGRDTVAGAYRTYSFDITDALQPGGENVLAVQVFAPTEKDLGINWVDWNPCPPDKDMGLWGAVDLLTTGAVTLRSPLAVTHFEDDSLKTADLTLYADVQNATDATVQGVVRGTAAGAEVQQAVTLAPHEARTIVFSPEKYPALRFHKVQPWWPAQMGEPHLETLHLAFQIAGKTSDEHTVRFGFREMRSELVAGGARLFRVNGKPILIRGAGWTQDMLLRTDPERLRKQFRMIGDMHLNTVRLEGKLETEDFYRLADEQGILVMLGWCCCDHWEDWKSWTPEDRAIAAASLHDQIVRLRHHASLLVWLNGSDNAPPPDVEEMYLKVEAEAHWPNPTLAAASTVTTVGGGASGVKMSGPYDYVAPSYWYLDQHFGGGASGFNTETSAGPAIPSLASRKKFLIDPEAWPPTADWKLHDGGGEFATLTVFDAAMAATYKPPSSAQEYEQMAQTMAYDTERAMFESYGKNKYTSTGVIQWMLNNAWPSMIWHLYDYYLDADAGYFAAKKACEPLHIQYSYDDRSVVVVNSTYLGTQHLHAAVKVYTPEWRNVYNQEFDLQSTPDSAQRITAIPEILYAGNTRILLVDLKLDDEAGKTVSRNFYWVPVALPTYEWNRTDFTHTPIVRFENLTALTELPRVQLTTSVELHTHAQGNEMVVHVTNPSQTLAFQVHAAVRTATDDLVAPVFWSDNWIEIAPGESTTLTAQLLPGTDHSAVVQLSGWNVAPVTLTPVAAER